MPDKAWKVFERRVCRALGAERRGPTGRDMSDCDDTAPFSVEVKHRKRLSLSAKDLEQARRHAKAEAKPWLLVQCLPGSQRPVATLDFWELASLAQEAGLIGAVVLDSDDAAEAFAEPA
jgi:hypothetical protein